MQRKFRRLRSFLYGAIILCLCWRISYSQDTKKLTLHFFGSPTCGECLEIKETILYPLVEQHHDKIDLQIHDIDSDSGFNLAMRMEDDYGITSSAAIELFFPDTFLLGDEAIFSHGTTMIEFYLAHPGRWKSRFAATQDTIAYAEKLKEKFRRFSFVSILAAGIIDGINPCAIATMIFLISFLATQKRKRRDILVIGLSFSGAVFITYLLLGIGAFKALTFLKEYRWVSQAVRWSAVAIAGGVGIYSFRDAVMFGKTKKTQDIKLQLPKSVKLRIHKIISGNLATGSLITGALVTGFLVTLLEAVCTGQVYLPTIVLMTRQEGIRFIGWLYLVFYNFLFILPLLIVMVLAYYGLKWEKLAKTTQAHLSFIKILFGVVLIGLAVFLALAG